MTVGILIPIPRAFVLTATANSLVGAELYVYQNLTTTPVTLYSDRACTTPAANPIVSSAGFFPRRYMASAQLLTLTLKNTAGSTVHSDDYVAGSAESGNEVYNIALTTAGGTTAYTLTTGLSLGAYASGVAFLIKMNATNTGASTLNVDGLGAKDLTKNGSTALSSGDLVSGRIYRVAYDGTRFQVVGVIPDATDATLVALAGLSTSADQYIRATGTDTFTMDSLATVATKLAGAKASFSAHKNGSNQASITSATETKLTFGTEEFDVGGYYDTTNSRWTPPAGKVRISGVVSFSGTIQSAGATYLALYKNGSLYKAGAPAYGANTGVAAAGGAWIADANGTDYFELYGYGTTSSGSLTATGTATVTYFQGEQL